MSLEKSDLHRFLFINIRGGSGMNTGGAHKKLVVARSFTADGNLLQPTGGVNRTPSHVTFSRICMHV